MSNMQRVNKANKLHSQLQKTTNVEDRIKLHQAAIKMIEGRENEDPDDADMSNRAQKNNEFDGIQSIPLLSTNSRGPTLSSFDPSTTEGITSSTSNESLHRQRRVRRHSVSSESSTSSTGRSRKSASRNASLSQIPALSRERLTPDAEKRVFNYNYRGPIPTKHHCQRSLFGKTVDVTPEPVETPKSRSQTKNRTLIRHHSNHEIPKYDHRPGMHLHESSCDAARKLQASKSSTNVSTNPKNFCPHKTPPRLNKGSHENLFQSSAKKRLDAWQPIEKSKSSHSVKTITSSTPNKHTEEDSDGYAIPSVSEPDGDLLRRDIITPPELYKTPAVNYNQEGSGNDSFESAKEFQTPVKKNVHRCGKERPLPKESLQDEIEAEIAAIDTVLANVSPSRNKIPKLIQRSINLTPSTDYRNLKDTSVEKNYEEVQAAIKSKSKDKFDSSGVYSLLKDKAAGDVTSSSISKSQDRSPVKTPSESTVDTNVTPVSAFEDIQYSNLFPRYNFDTPKASKSNDKNEKKMTPNTKFRTSLSRDTLIKSFKEALDINITAKKRFLKYEKQYYEKIKDLKKLERIDIELAKFPNIAKKAMEDVKTVTVDYTEKAWRKVLTETEKLQNDAREFVKLTNENKEKRRRKSQNFGLLGNIDANEFERKHFENLSRRHENAVRISEAVKKVNIERAIVELQERKAIKDLVRLSLDNKTIAGLSQSKSVTESTITRRSVTLTSTEIRKLAEDALNNKRKLGKVVSKPELPHIEQESANVISERKSLSSASVILSSRHHARIIETQITDMLFVSDNNFIPSQQSGIPSAASSVVPRLDFSAFEDSASNKAKTFEPVANVEQNNILEDIVIPDLDTEIISIEQQSKEPSNDKTERSDGRTSRDVSSISEFEPPPASVERLSNDDKKTENDTSTIPEIDESVHDDSTLTPDSTTNHAEPKPVEHLQTPTEASIFSALPSTRSHDGLQSLPDSLSANSESKNEKEEEGEPKETLPIIEHMNADSDPERLPLSATTAGTFNASPISSSRLLGDSPIPSPPVVAPSFSSAPGEKETEIATPNVPEDLLAEEEQSISEVSNLQNVFSSKSSSTTTESSKVVVPSSLENSFHDTPKPVVTVVIEPDEKSTTSVSTESSTTTSVASTVSKTTSSKSSSASSKDKSKPDSAKSSGGSSVPEDLQSAQSTTSSDFSSFLPSNRENNSQTIKNTVATENKPSQSSPADEVSEYSFSISGHSQANDQPKSIYHRRKSWDMVETGIIGKQSPSYLKNDSVDHDITGIFNNEPPKFESAPSPLGPYAAVSPRSPRSEHSRRHPFSKSPPLPKPSSSKGFADNFEKFLLEDVSLTNIAAPIFDISGGSERGSLGFKDDKNVLDWSPGLSREFSQPKTAKSVEKIKKEEEEPISAPITDDTSISTEIGEPPLDRSVEGTVKEIEKLCHEIWPQIETSMESGDFDSIIAPIINSEDPEQHYHDAYRRFIAASLLSEAQSTLKKGIKFYSYEQFKNRMTDALLNKLSIERKNDLLDGRHIWVRKNNAFMKLVRARQEAQDYDSELVNDYKRNLICKAIAAEDIINYSNERANRFTDIGYDECVEFLQKHAPEQLNDLLAQYEN